MKGSDDILALCAREGWRAALTSALEGEELERAIHPERSSFIQLMPVREGGVVLELGAAWGGITAELAKAYRVVAVESVSRRAAFITLRAKQEGQGAAIEVLTRDWLDSGLGDLGSRRFDGIVVHESAAALPRDCLESLRQVLAPGGLIYVGARNRLGWSGSTPLGERARSLTHAGYARSFAAAGLRIRETYVSPRGYLNPSELVPLQDQAITHYTRMRLEPPGFSPRRKLANQAKQAMASERFWRLFGPDFAFLLEAARGAHA